MLNKLVRDGKVAVVYSPGFGAGWSTWNPKSVRAQLCMDAELAEAVLAGELYKAEARALELCKDAEVYLGGSSELEVMWIPVGERFIVQEYDGSESIRRISDDSVLTA